MDRRTGRVVAVAFAGTVVLVVLGGVVACHARMPETVPPPPWNPSADGTPTAAGVYQASAPTPAPRVATDPMPSEAQPQQEPAKVLTAWECNPTVKLNRGHAN